MAKEKRPKRQCPHSMYGRVRDAVLRLGECSAAQVYAEVARFIPAPVAARSGRGARRRDTRRHRGAAPYRRKSLVERGGRALVCHILARMARDGDIRRVRKAVYAPLLPKLFGDEQRGCHNGG
jgi:hypothetical protein